MPRAVCISTAQAITTDTGPTLEVVPSPSASLAGVAAQVGTLAAEARAVLGRLGYGMLGVGLHPAVRARAGRLQRLQDAAPELRLRRPGARMAPLVDRERGVRAGDRRRHVRRGAPRPARAAPAGRPHELPPPQRPRPLRGLRGPDLGAPARVARSRSVHGALPGRRRQGGRAGARDRHLARLPGAPVGAGAHVPDRGEDGRGGLGAAAPLVPGLPRRGAGRRLARADAGGGAGPRRARVRPRGEDGLDLHGVRAHPLEVGAVAGRAAAPARGLASRADRGLPPGHGSRSS